MICENGVFLFSFCKQCSEAMGKRLLNGKVNGLNWDNLEISELKC